MASGGKIDLTVSLDVDVRGRQVLEALGWATPTVHQKLRDELERLHADPLAALSPEVRKVVDDTVENWRRDHG